jgi:phage-related protein
LRDRWPWLDVVKEMHLASTEGIHSTSGFQVPNIAAVEISQGYQQKRATGVERRFNRINQ